MAEECNNDGPCPLCEVLEEALKTTMKREMPLANATFPLTTENLNFISKIRDAAFRDGYRQGVMNPQRELITGSNRLCKVCKEPLNAFGVCKNYNEPSRHPANGRMKTGLSYDYLRGYHDAVKDIYL